MSTCGVDQRRGVQQIQLAFQQAVWFGACLIPAVAGLADDPQTRLDVAWETLRDINGQPANVDDAKWKVVCFLGAECPLARLYGPRLDALHRRFRSRDVRVLGVNSNPQDSVADIKAYVADHRLQFPVVKDRHQELARRFQAVRTPEVFVVDQTGRVRYRGRIDDQYEPGLSRAEPQSHDLIDALQTLLDGGEVDRPRTTAVGCRITFVQQRSRTAPPATVTFTRDVASVLNQHCVECHRAGEIGPFALQDYDEVVGWGEMILEVTEQQRMPPWHADPTIGRFAGARRLSDAARQTLIDWVDQGMPRGEPNDLPEPPRFADGWHLPTDPDVELVMRRRPFVVPAEGTVEYQYFVVDPQWDEDRWVQAAQVVPGEASVVHHVIVFVRPPDGTKATGIGWMGGYVPGQRTPILPAGHARRIAAGSKLVFQMHYTPNGRETKDTTRVGVWFAQPDEVTHEVTTRVAINQDFEIPPGKHDHEVTMRIDGFARESTLLGAMPHMHLRGKSFHLAARRGDRRESLLSVPRYDFNWQHWYAFAEPLPLAEIDALHMRVHFDNSASNPANPDPQEFVTWGDQTWQEMAVAFFDVAHPRDKPRVVVRRTAQLDGDPSQPSSDTAARQQRIDRQADRFLSQMDRDGDGMVTRDEVPVTFRRFAFRPMDQNRDGRLDRDEIEQEAARRL